VRLTIEKLRIVVLGAAVLLLVALLVFLAVGKGKNPFNHGDVPKRLGIEIQQEANGVTYTQAHGGRTLFKIHASKVVQLKQGNALLHGVKIELYGEDGARVDRIQGDDFEYNQQAGIAVAAGPVEIILMQPGVAPAIAPKAAAGQAAGEKLKSAPVASAAQTATRGEIHVKTRGLIFNQNSGIAKTSQHVDFSMAQGSGSSMGATYDSDSGLLVLDHAVELTTKRGTQTVQIHSQRAEFERQSQLCLLREATADYQGGEAKAGDAKVLFREDGSAVRLDVMNGFTLATATGDHLASPTGHMEFDEHNQPRHGHMEGGVTMNSAREAAGRRRQIHGTSPAAELEFNAQGQLRHAHLEQGVTLDSQEQGEQSGQQERLSRHWRSPVADMEFRDSRQGQIELSTVRGTGGVVITGESQRGQGAVVPSRLSADDVTGMLGPHSVLTGMNGVGHASVEETTETGTRQTTNGDRLTAHFAAAPAVKRGQGNETQLQSATVEGHVVLTQTPAARPGVPPPAAMHATAGRADYDGQGDWLHLTLAPRVEDGALQLTAEKVDVSRSSGDAFAHGNVKASWMDASAGVNGQPGRPQSSTSSQGIVALGGQGPAHVISAEAQLRHAVGGTTGEAIFRGHARLWQQANSVAAPVIVLDREKQTLVARTTDASEPVRAVLLSAGGAAPGKNAGNEQEKTNQPSVIRVRGGDLKYSDVERKAVMHPGILGSVVTEIGTTTLISNEVEVTLLPAGKAADKDSGQVQGQAEVDTMTARGHVVLTSEGRRGTGEQMVYTSATGEYVLTGTAAVPPRMSDPARGTVTGKALIFHGRDDSVSVEGGEQKATTVTTAPK
jgi:lipopolysaccharide export system protein LptA